MRKAIVDGHLQPGRHLKERELCEMFQVSRSLVREAVQKLVGERLLTVVPHRGLSVSTLDRHAARELYKVRAVLEGLSCAEFTDNASDQEREKLFAVAARLGTLSENDPAEALIDAKNDFYRCLMEGSRNATLSQMFTQLNNRIVQLRRLSLSQPGRLPRTLKEISQIVEAIRKRDAATARRLAERHVAAAGRVADLRFEELLKETEQGKPSV